MAALHAKELFRDDRHLVITIEAVDFQHDIKPNGCILFGKITPIAVIICNADTSYALDMAAQPVALDQLKQNTPELDAIIASYME